MEQMVKEPVVKVARTTPQERTSECVGEQMWWKTLRKLTRSLLKHNSERTVDQGVDVPMPEILKKIVEAMQPLPRERSRQRIVEQIVFFLVPQVVEELASREQMIAQERIS